MLTLEMPSRRPDILFPTANYQTCVHVDACVYVCVRVRVLDVCAKIKSTLVSPSPSMSDCCPLSFAKNKSTLVSPSLALLHLISTVSLTDAREQ
jgi:hypothetical protein